MISGDSYLISERYHESFRSAVVVSVVEGFCVNQKLEPVLYAVFYSSRQLQIRKPVLLIKDP